MSEVDLQPDYSAVVQSEPTTDPPIAVCVTEIKAPTRTQRLPHKAAATGTKTITTNVQPLLRADHYRARVTLIASGNPVLVAFSLGSAGDPSTMFLLPVGIPFDYYGDTGVWVAASTATATITFATGLWATGD